MTLIRFFFLSIIFLFIIELSNAEDTGLIIEYREADSIKDKYKRIKKFEIFLEKYSPLGRGYEDSNHVRYYRLAKYRLIYSYINCGNKSQAIKLLKWLEEYDESFK